MYVIVAGGGKVSGSIHREGKAMIPPDESEALPSRTITPEESYYLEFAIKVRLKPFLISFLLREGISGLHLANRGMGRTALGGIRQQGHPSLAGRPSPHPPRLHPQGASPRSVETSP